MSFISGMRRSQAAHLSTGGKQRFKITRVKVSAFVSEPYWAAPFILAGYTWDVLGRQTAMVS